MDNPVLKELLLVLPDWSSRLRVFSSRYPETLEPSPPSRKRGPSISSDEDEPKPTTVIGPHALRPAPADDPKQNGKEKEKGKDKEVECIPPPKTMSRMNAKPTPPKAKFSAINGPQIYYDGEAQTALFECWTTLNAKRGLLRKEMMGIRRKKIMTLPAANYGYSDSESDEEGGDGETKPKETEEERKARLAAEKRKADEERKKAEKEKKAAEVLEFIDSCLDKAAKGCENAAFLWLKGEACSGHVNFIAGRMQDAVDRINMEFAKLAKPEVEAKKDDDDEGLGDDVEMEDATQSLPGIDERPIIRPYRRAGGFAIA